MNLYTYRLGNETVFNQKLNELFARIHEAGIPEKLTDWSTINITKKYMHNLQETHISIVTFEDFLEIFYLFIGSLFPCFLVFLVEVYYANNDRIRSFL